MTPQIDSAATLVAVRNRSCAYKTIERGILLRNQLLA
jgi:hypothetical protein